MVYINIHDDVMYVIITNGYISSSHRVKLLLQPSPRPLQNTRMMHTVFIRLVIVKKTSSVYQQLY